MAVKWPLVSYDIYRHKGPYLTHSEVKAEPQAAVTVSLVPQLCLPVLPVTSLFTFCKCADLTHPARDQSVFYSGAQFCQQCTDSEGSVFFHFWSASVAFQLLPYIKQFSNCTHKTDIERLLFPFGLSNPSHLFRKQDL